MGGLDKSSFDRIIRNTLSSGQPRASSLYGIVDTARDSALYRALFHAGTRSRCLLGTALPDVLVRASPFIVALPEQESLRTQWQTAGRGRAWGILVRASASLEALAQHFGGLLEVRLEDGEAAYLRYYDPRVLRVFLPTCTPDQLAQMFGPVEAFVCEQADGSWLRYRLVDGQLATSEDDPFSA